MNPGDFLRQAKAIIADPTRWTQGTGARDASGTPCDPKSPEATCYCTWGVFFMMIDRLGVKRLSATALKADKALYLAASGMSGGMEFPGGFNDRYTHSEVMAMWDMAISIADNVEVWGVS